MVNTRSRGSDIDVSPSQGQGGDIEERQAHAYPFHASGGRVGLADRPSEYCRPCCRTRPESKSMTGHRVMGYDHHREGGAAAAVGPLRMGRRHGLGTSERAGVVAIVVAEKGSGRE